MKALNRENSYVNNSISTEITDLSGGDYAHQAIIDQLKAATAPGGDRNDAYNGVAQLNAGVEFKYLTPEQQADVAREIGVTLDNGGTLSTELSEAHDSIERGEGAI